MDIRELDRYMDWLPSERAVAEHLGFVSFEDWKTGGEVHLLAWRDGDNHGWTIWRGSDYDRGCLRASAWMRNGITKMELREMASDLLENIAARGHF